MHTPALIKRAVLLATPFVAGHTIGSQHGEHLALNERQSSGAKPLVVTNKCSETIYPGLLTQSGTGPGTGGFALTPGNSRTLSVGEAWQGRVWGRTNCSFNSDGTAPSGNSQNGQACGTGDCGGIVNCRGAGVTPVSLAEFTLDTGSGQTFYDISLVDGYNIPMAIVLRPSSNSSLDSIPPNLTNPSCVGTAGNAQAPNWNPYTSGQGDFLGTNSSNPMPLENQLSLAKIGSWCPTNLEVKPLSAPVGGVYTYPDGNVQRPAFDPCFSACAKTGSNADCCLGSYDSPSSCSPNVYSRAAKAVCPDAYSYAFDDQTSTFIVPSGAGFEVVFCPGGRSTNILATSKAKLTQLAQSGSVSHQKGGLNLQNLLTPSMAPVQDPLSSPHGGAIMHAQDNDGDSSFSIKVELMDAVLEYDREASNQNQGNGSCRPRDGPRRAQFAFVILITAMMWLI